MSDNPANTLRQKSTLQAPLDRAGEANDLISAVKDLVVQYIRAADEDAVAKGDGHGLRRRGDGPRSTLVEQHPPKKLEQLMNFTLPEHGLGKDGFMSTVQQVLRYSVNTWDQGFLDKLYANTTPVGVATDLLLSSLNTNLHVYQVSPALTIIEKHTAKALATMFGFRGPAAGGVSQPGGSAANQSSMVIARNNLFPDTKAHGYGDRRFVLFTSAHGHYSIEKAAQMFGFGSKSVRAVPVDDQGRMRPDALDDMVMQAKANGETPFYVNATAGTTVLGSFDPLHRIADVCTKHGLWMHVDGSWGAPVIFSPSQRHKLDGIERANSITLCPHKMMNVPLTCSFLLGQDLHQFHKGMTLPAGYLFHDSGDEIHPAPAASNGVHDATAAGVQQSQANITSNPEHRDYWDLADLTPQCGRRGDSLKLALTWQYIGSEGFAAYIDAAFASAAYLTQLVAQHPNFTLVSQNPPPCLQVCFYYRKQAGDPAANSRTTEDITKRLIARGFMTDYAPGDEGKFFRVVVNGQTRKETLDGLVKAIESVVA